MAARMSRLGNRHTLRSMVCMALFLALLGTAPPGTEADEGASGPKTLEGVLTPYLDRYTLPALSAAVVKDGTIVAAGAVGVRRVDARIPVKLDDRFHIGSDTKAMTALLLAMLVEEGKLRWDSTVAGVFPELASTMAPGVGAITLAQLLSHTSGYPADNERFGELLYASFRQEGNLDDLRYWILAQWVREPLAEKPGKVFAYSNMGYVTAGAMAERVTDTTYEELMFERVFRPLGMKSAGFGPQSHPGRVDAPVPHLLEHDQPKAFLAGPNGDNPLVLGPAGTAHMSVLDFARWAGWNAGEGKRGPPLVKAETLEKLHEPVIEFQRPDAAPGTPSTGKYALGWGMMFPRWRPSGIGMHAGSNGKNLATIYILPEADFAMVTMTNIGGRKAHDALIALAEELYGAYGPRTRVK